MRILSRWRQKLERKGSSGGLAGPISVGALNQLVRSGSNFLLGLYLINVLTPANYGLFGIGFSVTLFLLSIANTVFFLQMIVHTPDKPIEERPAYAAHIFILAVLFCASAIAVTMLLISGGVMLLHLPAAYSDLSIAVLMASCAVILKEFFVRHAYNQKNEIEALRIDLILAVAMVTLFLWQYYQGFSITATTALWIFTAAHVLAGVYAILVARLPFRNISILTLKKAAREAWQGGRWESLTGILAFVRSQSHIIAATYFLGPIGVAKLNAARLLVSPALIVAPAVSQVALPRIADLRKKGPRAVLRSAFLLSIGLTLAAAIYCTVLLLGFDQIVAVLLDSNYADIFFLTFAWCLYACFLAFRSGNQLGIHALRQFRFFAATNATAAAVAIVLACILTYKVGLIGAVSSSVIGELVLVVMMLRFGRRYLRANDPV